MTITDIKDRYDSFQKHAVKAIIKDFQKKINGRYLLVIPTGGGKTYTAVKSVCALFDSNVLSVNKHKVLWVAHRKELIDQARTTFESYIDESSSSASLDENINVVMISQVKKLLAEDETIKLVVIDEAHHAAAVSYQPIFDKVDVGILGLTATPSRHDGKPLEFERESFSIGFPDLIKKQIILKPKVHTINSDDNDIESFDNDELEKLNNDARNTRIINEIQSKTDSYKKIIIFVGTKKHAEDLYEILINSSLNNGNYQSISYIVGDKNSRNQDREDFISEEKSFKRSILVNVQMLTEGYDDPSVNTVIMATPTKSKLYYMQAMGRAVRIDPENQLKKAYVVEVVEKLPNIRYRIDNRWLYSDISDALEPDVIDVSYSSETIFTNQIEELFSEYNVPQKYQKIPEYDEDTRYSMLLFKQYINENSYIHYPIILDNNNRTRIANMFNFISERMALFRKKETNCEAVFNMIGGDILNLISAKAERRLIYDGMENSCATLQNESDEDIPAYIKNGYPWIKFVSLQFIGTEDEIADDLSEFIKDFINKEDILDLLKTKNYESGSILIRLPLPLGSFIGEIVTEIEYDKIDNVIMKLTELKSNSSMVDHRFSVDQIIGNARIPIEIKSRHSLVLIARESVDYSYKL